ncbi:hypothetical protein Adi01nite_72890 [Amorphoplanes digitatis]|uniref:Uncharacterized protein n=1 Tax=Actinoplanes digitatis TaxID=1868 RepID=A0A7W7MUG4_9ACTN|nr:hypothetical protein [Actinoplanes digitatis]GID97877.1 hypothetical protein Adi01nite_72890 [Actinoplanes digitatis]
MAVPNAGPHQPDPTDRGNLTYRDELRSSGMEAASTRATTVSQRFGGVRYALTRSDNVSPMDRDPNEGGDPDANH